MSIEAMKQAIKDLEDANGMAYSELSVENLYGETIATLRQAIEQAEKQEPIAYITGTYGGRFTVKPLNPAMVLPLNMALYTTQQPQQAEKQEPPKFPIMLRKMWSGTEVQDWINENWNKP